MIFLHLDGLETYYGGLAYNRYFPMLIQYFKKINAKFIPYSQFQGFDKVNEDIVLTGPDSENISTMVGGLKLLNDYKLNNYKCKLYYLSSDIWPRADKIFNNIQETIVKAEKYKLIHVCLNTEYLAYLWSNTVNINKYLDNYVYFQYNYYYDGIIVDYNPNPINKVLLSGNTIPSLYPERVYLKELNLPSVEVLPFVQISEYTKQLNSYICSFVSNAAAVDPHTGKLIPAKFLLLKYLEVLGSGSLLLADDSMEKELETIGLKNKESFYVSSMSNIHKAVDYITNPENREEIDRIRLNGQNAYKDYKLRMDKEIEEVFKDLV
jgi:hypothetical protein